MDWSELEMMRGAKGHIVISETLSEFDPAKKAFVDVPVKVRVPRPDDLLQARVDVRVMFAQRKLDPEGDKDLFEEFEQLCLLAKLIRDPATEGQLYEAEELKSKVDEGPLQAILGRIRVYRDMLDPRESMLTEDDVYRKIIDVARAGHCLPLTGIAGFEQPSFIVSMAELAASSPIVLAWLQSLGNSTPAPLGPVS